MGTSVETRTIRTCDICGRESTTGLLTKCLVCEKEFCSYSGCDINIYNPYRLDICKKCGGEIGWDGNGGNLVLKEALQHWRNAVKEFSDKLKEKK